jgi:putative ABC transport system permease protein
MTLGARPLQVLAMVIREGISVGAMGLVAGLVGALALGRLLTTFLYGIAPTDPVSFGTAAAALLAVALIASYLPARRAMRVDPLVALRCE